MSGPYAVIEGAFGTAGVRSVRSDRRGHLERPVSVPYIGNEGWPVFGLYMVIKGGHMERSVPVPYKVKRGASSARSVQKFFRYEPGEQDRGRLSQRQRR